MLTFRELGELTGLSSPISTGDVALVFGIVAPFSCRQLVALAATGAVPRPFYVVGHNTNTMDDVRVALANGANAVEVDVNVFEDEQNELCISETGTLDADKGGDVSAPPLIQ